VERQKELVEAGASWTMNSNHLKGHAIDFAVTVNGDVRWDWPLYGSMSEVFKGAATLERVPIVWGGDWKKKKDGPHIELDQRVYGT
jgi:peptidoglycan L-alanyl-D-glutamate endopeptidase CwlK